MLGYDVPGGDCTSDGYLTLGQAPFISHMGFMEGPKQLFGLANGKDCGNLDAGCGLIWRVGLARDGNVSTNIDKFKSKIIDMPGNS